MPLKLGWGEEENTEFYKEKSELSTNNQQEYIITACDFNAKVSNVPIKGVTGTNEEAIINQNGKLLTNFADFSDMRTTNAFFKQ
jgi:hypothetical protein